jgi:hypothetical protein
MEVLRPVHAAAIVPAPVGGVNDGAQVYEIDPLRDPRWAA